MTQNARIAVYKPWRNAQQPIIDENSLTNLFGIARILNCKQLTPFKWYERGLLPKPYLYKDFRGKKQPWWRVSDLMEWAMGRVPVRCKPEVMTRVMNHMLPTELMQWVEEKDEERYDDGDWEYAP